MVFGATGRRLSPIAPHRVPHPSAHRVPGPIGLSFDACPWGWGAIRTHKGIVTHWATGTWDSDTLTRFGATVGGPTFQTDWEFLACSIALEL